MANNLRDWIVVNIDNPGFTPTDFKIVGLTAADTQLRPFDDYLNNPIVTDDPRFKDNNGNFSKDKFKEFYDNASLGFLKFSLDYDTFKYDLFDPKRKLDSEIKNPNFELTQISNPSHYTTGIRGRNLVANGPMSDKELAQLSKVFDPLTGTYSELSLDEQSLFKNPIKWILNIFSDPVVYATFDSDGTHIDPITGREVEHKKGDFRINEDGEYFTEKLAGRNIRGKEIVSVLDLITSDTQGINKYDFFDADGLDKSIVGSLFNAAASIAPLFVPGLGEVYSTALISRELAKSIPMLSGMLDGLLGTNLEESSLLNRVAAYGEKFTGGTSEYSKEKSFTIENLSKLVSDVVTLWGQLKLIAKGISKLSGTEQLLKQANKNATELYLTKSLLSAASIEASVQAKQITAKEGAEKLLKLIGVDDLNKLDEAISTGKWAESTIGKAAISKFMNPIEKTVLGMHLLGADASLAYMAIVSNTDVYLSLIDHGTTKGEAALFTLGSIMGMFGVDKYAHLGELFFDELRNSDKYISRNISEMVGEWTKDFKNDSKVLGKNAVLRIINRGREFGNKYVMDYISQFTSDLRHHTTGFLGKALGEGLEEVSEELVTDFTKSLYLQLGNFGFVSLKDVGAWENAGSRYGMSLLGGALGGGMFYGVEAFQGKYPIKEGDQDILYHIRNGKTKDYLDRIDEWEKKGKFGETTLSATNYNEVVDKDGETKRVYLSAENEKDSQNHFIAERVRQGIKLLDGIINGNNLDLTDEELFENMVMSELRYMDLKDWLLDESYAVNYHETYLNLLKDIVKVDQELLTASDTIDGTVNGEKLQNKDLWLRDNRDTERGRAREENLQKLRDRKELLIKLKDDFLSADTSFYYTRKMLFALDRELASNFFPTSFEEYVKQNKKVDVSLLNNIDKENYHKEYIEYQLKLKKQVLTELFSKFLEFEKILSPHILDLENNSRNFKEYFDIINKIFLLNPLDVEYVKLLEGESEEDIERFRSIVGESGESVQLLNEEDISNLEASLVEVDESEWKPALEDLLSGKDVIKNAEKLKNLTNDSELKDKLNDYIFVLNRINLIDEENKRRKQESYRKILDVLSETGKKLDPIAYRMIIDSIYKRKKDFVLDIIEGEINKLDLSELSVLNIEDIKSKIRNITIDNNGNVNSAEIFKEIKEYLELLKISNVLKANREVEKWDNYVLDIFLDLNQALYGDDPGELRILDILEDLENNLQNYNRNESGAIDEKKENQLNSFLSFIVDYIKLSIESSISNPEALEIVHNELSNLQINTRGNNILEVIDSISSIKEDLDDLIDDDSTSEELKNNLTEISGELQNAIVKLSEIVSTYSWNNIVDDTKQINEQLSIDTNKYVNSLNLSIDNILKDLSNDEDIKFINNINNTTKINNPFIDFITSIGSKIGIEGIEEQLVDIFNNIHLLEKVSDFRLTILQMDLLLKVSDVLKLVLSYLIAASLTGNILVPYGHNRTINLLINNNKSKFQNEVELLPEISDDTFIIWEQELRKYLVEIDSRIELASNNAVNKAKRFVNTAIVFDNVRLLFLEGLRKELKFTIDDKEVDLFNGYESINTDNLNLKLLLLEELLYANFNKLISSGYSLELILSSSKIIEKLCTLDARTSVSQLTSTKLDENLEYGDFTLYDRLIYFITTISLNNRDWIKFLKSQISEETNDIVPLTVQQYVARIGVSFLNNPDIFKSIISYIDNNNILGEHNKTIIDNLVFISGIGGAGKSRVAAKYIVDYATLKLGINQDDILISGSTDDVRQAIKESVVKGTIKESKNSVPGNSELIKMAIDPNVYKEIMDDINNKKTNSKYYTTKLANGGTSILLNWDKISINKSTAPKLLIIDEITHFSSAEILILSKWVNGNIIALGDTNQGSFNGLGGNIDRETMFTIRTPKLRISLRDTNLQNQENQIYVSELLDYISDAEADDPNYVEICKQFILNVRNLKIHGHVGDNLNGTIYLNDITPNIVSKLSGSVAFVGLQNSLTYETIKSQIESVKLFNSVESILGQEFDYIVIDDDFGKLYFKLINSSKVKELALGYYYLLKDFYTLLSRGKIGSIFINNDSTIGVNILDKQKADVPPLSLDNFKNSQLTDIQKYLETPEIKVSEKVKEVTEEKKDDVIYNPEDVEEPPVEVLKVKVEEVEIVLDEDRDNIDPILANGVVFPAYTNFNIRGARGEVEEIGDLKYAKIYAAEEGEVKRGIEIFMSPGLVLDPRASSEEDQEEHLRKYNIEKTRYEGYLRSLVNGILYGHEYSELNISDDISLFFSEETYNKLKDNIYIVAREIDDSRDVIMNTIYGGTEGKTVRSISNNKLVEIVAEADGLIVPLGLLLDPKTAESEKDKLRKSIQRTQKRLKDVLDLEIKKGRIVKDDELYQEYMSDIGELLSRYNSVDADTKKYKEEVDKITQKDSAKERVKLNNNGFSYLKKLKKPLSLSAVKRDKNISTSRVLIYDGGLPGVNDSAMVGRAVVLQSGDNTLTSDQLIEDYTNLREQSETSNPLKESRSKPNTRMMVLTSKGFDISDILNSQINTPIAWGQVGMKLFVSAWNFRANLLNFLAKYNLFLEENGYTSEEKKRLVEKVATNMDDEFLGRESTYKDLENYEEIKLKINAFNDSLGDSVKQFRLGGREEVIAGNTYGSQYIRQIKNASKKLYKDPDSVYGIYIHPERAKVYENTLNAYFKAISPIINPITSDPNKMDTSKDVIKGSLNPMLLITTAEGAANNIQGYITEMYRNLEFKVGDVTLSGTSGLFPAFTIATFKILRQAIGVGNPSYDIRETYEDNSRDLVAKVSVGDEEIKLDTKDIFLETVISPDSRDYTISNMFRLIIHGTTKNVFETNNPKSTDAYFKKGIFIHPKIGKNKINKYFYECTTEESLFYLDALAMSPKVSIEKYTEEEEEEKRIKEELNLLIINRVKYIESVFPDIGIDIDNIENIDELEEIIKQSIDDYIQINKSNIFTSSDPLNNIVDYVILDDAYIPITLELKIKSEFGLDEFNISNVAKSSDFINIKYNGNNTINIKLNNKNNIILNNIIEENEDESKNEELEKIKENSNQLISTLELLLNESGKTDGDKLLLLNIASIKEAISLNDNDKVSEEINKLHDNVVNEMEDEGLSSNVEDFIENEDIINKLKEIIDSLAKACSIKH